MEEGELMESEPEQPSLIMANAFSPLPPAMAKSSQMLCVWPILKKQSEFKTAWHRRNCYKPRWESNRETIHTDTYGPGCKKMTQGAACRRSAAGILPASSD
jgi:hypothetical protein